MFTQKTRVIIASILLIAVLALALRGRIIWEEITQWIMVQSLPLITSQSEPLEQPKQLPEQPLSMHMTSQLDSDLQTSTIATTSDEPQIIPTPEIVETVKKSRVARRRRKKESEPVFAPTELFQALPASVPPELLPSGETCSSKATPISNASEPCLSPSVSATSPFQAMKKTIRIRNKIDANTLGVKHWTGTYTPTKLEITLNNVPFTIVGDNPTALEALQEIPCPDNRITVHYLYEFLNGMRKGSDTIIYMITDHAAQLEMLFSWDTPWHVELNGAQRVK